MHVIAGSSQSEKAEALFAFMQLYAYVLSNYIKVPTNRKKVYIIYIMVTLTKLAQSLLVYSGTHFCQKLKADEYGGDESCTKSKLKLCCFLILSHSCQNSLVINIRKLVL